MLYVSQPALSQMIRSIEKEIDAKIFNRSATNISLTYAGEKYVETAYKMLELEKNLTGQLQEIKNEDRGKIRIGISTLRGIVFLPEILPIFIKRYPAVAIEIVETGSANMDELLLQNKVDLAFLITVQEMHPEIHYVTLCRERLVLYAGRETQLVKNIPPLTEIRITDTIDETFISLKPGHGIRTIQDHLFFQNNINPRIFLETNNIFLARKLASSCNMVTLYPETLMTSGLSFFDSAEECYYPIADDQNARRFFLCYNKREFLPKYMQEFIDIAQKIQFNSLPTHIMG